MQPDHAVPPTERLRFARRTSVEQVEEGTLLAPKFDRDGLIPVVTTDADTGEVLMVATMDAEALLRTVDTREAHYWSRSRQARWRKGASSGLVQDVVEIRIDDDQDAVWLRVRVRGSGASCHVGYRSCFYRSVKPGGALPGGPVELRFEETEKVVDPKELYGDAPTPTRL
ncbi:phosphoribosyl-AMP cyclohydrolase [Reyranella sp.]|uniref:phosphoribosyl-AMP cyclohydrolase n=1 Tax=Reyranella sp. TaxID=1929291 RepID=UPI003BA9AD52